GGGAVKFWLTDYYTAASDFSLTTTSVKETCRMQSGAFSSDSIWLVSTSPDINFQSTPDPNTGQTHSFVGGAVRIGEFNYGNAWADFGFVDSFGIATRTVGGIDFFPNWIQGTTSDSNWTQYPVQWAINIGSSSAAPNSTVSKHWTALLVNTDAVNPG